MFSLEDATEKVVKYSDNQKTMEQEEDIIAILKVFDGFTKQIVLSDTYKINYFVKWVCLHCTIAVVHGY